jgi:L-ribulose-5-phosphate 3-epimerase
MPLMTRRTLLASAAAAALAPAAEERSRFSKGICSIIFPPSMPLPDCFERAKSAGFSGVEIPIGRTLPLDMPADNAKRLNDASRRAGITIVSLWVSEPFSDCPLNSPSPELRARAVEVIRRAITLATHVGSGALLLYPGRLGSGPKFQVGYEDTWNRFTEGLKQVIPDAERAKVLLTPENVWNKFLVSPLEMRAFVDQFHSPWLQTHFDIGNVMQFGYPQDWILTLGSRIKRVHVKDYKLSTRAEQGRFVDLWEGDVDWKGVMEALVKVGYRGFLSPEISYNASDPDQLRKVSAALDRILSLV